MTQPYSRTRAEDRASRAARLAELISRSGEGDAQAFESLYGEVAPLVYGTATKVLRDSHHAAEVTQEVLVEIWRNASGFDPVSGSVTSWAATIAHRRAVDRVRSVQSQRERDERAGIENYDPPRDAVVEQTEQSMERQVLLECLDTLSDLQRSTVQKAYYDGLTYRQVAERAGLALATVKSRIRDGLKKLRQCLEVQ
ncbi:sigma-70 family RNA polymerase sigma factor [Garicola koreensis]|uniref:ECF RNA polymerase sigma factor SigK n=1 Tax=Garicola koreensis TaxID=1262554 RepID=UPI0031F07855